MSGVRVPQGPPCLNCSPTALFVWVSAVVRSVSACRRVSTSGGAAVSVSRASRCRAPWVDFATRGRRSRPWWSSTDPIATTTWCSRRFRRPLTCISSGCARSATSSSRRPPSSAGGLVALARRGRGAPCATRRRCCRRYRSGQRSHAWAQPRAGDGCSRDPSTPPHLPHPPLSAALPTMCALARPSAATAPREPHRRPKRDSGRSLLNGSRWISVRRPFA